MCFLKKYYFIFIFGIIILLILFIPKEKEEEIIKNQSFKHEPLVEVYIYGDIGNPGKYYIKKDSTIKDLLKECGIVDYYNINKVTLDEVVSSNQAYEVIKEDSSYSINYSTIKPQSHNKELININNACIEMLISLPKIGHKRANDIIEYRNNCPFKSISDIKNVNGINNEIFNQIKNFITV